MSDVASVSFKINNSEINLMNKKAVKGLFQMGFDVASQARENAPYVTGALRNTIRVQENGQTVEIIAGGNFGGFKVDYAYKREQGPNRDSSTEHYMENSLNYVMSGDWQTKYFGDLTK